MCQYHGAPVTTFWDGILLNNLQASSMLPHFAYMSTKLLPTKTSNSQRVWTSCLWTSLPSSNVRKAAQCFNQLNKSEFVRTHSLLLHLLEKLHHHLQSPILHMFCKLPIACKYVELHYTWCLCSYLCCHPWWVSSVLYTKCFPCVLVLKSGYPSFVNNQKSRSSWSAMYSPHPGNKYHKNRERCSDLLHQHLALTYFLQPTTTTPPVQRTWKEILPSLDQGRITTTNKEKEDWHQQEVWLHWHVNSDRFDVQLPSLTHDPNIAKDP